jgi:hypothetical protein
MAAQAGFGRGMYFITTMGNFFGAHSPKKLAAIPEIKAAFHFWPMITGNFLNNIINIMNNMYNRCNDIYNNNTIIYILNNNV